MVSRKARRVEIGVAESSPPRGVLLAGRLDMEDVVERREVARKQVMKLLLARAAKTCAVMIMMAKEWSIAVLTSTKAKGAHDGLGGGEKRGCGSRKCGYECEGRGSFQLGVLRALEKTKSVPIFQASWLSGLSRKRQAVVICPHLWHLGLKGGYLGQIFLACE